MTLHIFNPEHDHALAADLIPYTAPHAGRQLRADLAWLPALWAEDGDAVLVENVENALEQSRHFYKFARDVRFVTYNDLAKNLPIMPTAISAWGWNRALCHQLKRHAKSLALLLPDSDRLAFIRNASHRRWAAESLLPKLVNLNQGLVGTAVYVKEVPFDSNGTLMAPYRTWGNCVLKAPWSSSGRGIRYVGDKLTKGEQNWARNIIARQGGIMIEPYYNKIADFGMEFNMGLDGKVSYLGLSLFNTQNGSYSGSVLATEDEKRSLLGRYVSNSLLDSVCKGIQEYVSGQMKGKYAGEFGIDMMVVRQDGRLMLHPCVELNLRRTMGHVALALTPSSTEPRQLMRIHYDGSHYHLRIVTTGENLLNIDY